MVFRSAVLYFLAALGLLLLLIVCTPAVPATVAATEPDWFSGDGDVLVVLGGSMLISGTGPQATLGYDTYLRCVFAASLLRSQSFHLVIVSGSDGMAETMAKFLVQNGVNPRSILTERSAQTTYQNAAFTKRILDVQYSGKALPAVVILTSDYHAWRALRTFKHCGFTAQAIPIPDVIKRSSQRSFRLTGTVTVLSEWLKDIYYIASGRA